MSGEAVHPLWTVVAVVAAGAWAASAMARGRRHRRLRIRSAALFAAEEADTARAEPLRSWPRQWWPRARPWAAPLGVVVIGQVFVGGVTGAVLGLGAAYGLCRWLRRQKPDDGTEAVREAAARQLPLAADLLAACLSAGAGPREAAEAVGRSLGGPVGGCLDRVAAELRLGCDPAVAWGRLGAIPHAEGLSRCLERAASTGVPAAEPVSRLADGLRAEQRRAAEARARRAGVLITGPVALCFLPAFLAAGVAPVVIGLAGELLGGK
ncbi:type II secretion system F family protein [Streptomyces sannanensis]|uniref:Type II secretion system F family protein n=1 Tax=Streptomyces sannanensis TaxID=285536 RepID=A0ABP6SDC7_9ACTN